MLYKTTISKVINLNYFLYYKQLEHTRYLVTIYNTHDQKHNHKLSNIFYL